MILKYNCSSLSINLESSSDIKLYTITIFTVSPRKARYNINHDIPTSKKNISQHSQTSQLSKFQSPETEVPEGLGEYLKKKNSGGEIKCFIFHVFILVIPTSFDYIFFYLFVNISNCLLSVYHICFCIFFLRSKIISSNSINYYHLHPLLLISLLINSHIHQFA